MISSPLFPNRHLLGRRLHRALAILREQGLVALCQQLRAAFTQYLAFRRYSRRQGPSPEMRRQMVENLQAFAFRPTISIVMPTYNTPERWLDSAIRSVQDQVYPHWELCIADDASSRPGLRAQLQRHADADPRIKLAFREQNGHISIASNEALSLAGGEFVALLDHDDELPPEALYVVAATLQQHPDADILFSDEDKISEGGHCHHPYFKPGYNYDLLLGQNAISHLGIYRRSLLNAIGGFRPGLEGSQDWDLALRAVEQTSPERIIHIPHVLYHWRTVAGSTAQSLDNKSYAATAGYRAVSEHLARTGQRGELLPVPHGQFRVRFALPKPEPRVSILLGDDDATLHTCVDQLLEHTDYPEFEVLTRAAPHSSDARVRQIGEDNVAANLSSWINQAATLANGQILCLLSTRARISDGDWLRELVAQACRPGVGAAGPLLLDSAGCIQQAGLVLGWNRQLAGSPYRGRSPDSTGYVNQLQLNRNVSALSRDCLVIPLSLFRAVGGMNATCLPDYGNDIDLSLRLIAQGLRLVWTPGTRIVMEPPPATETEGALAYLAGRWPLEHDPLYNPNLSLTHVWPTIALKSRAHPYWQPPAPCAPTRTPTP